MADYQGNSLINYSKNYLVETNKRTYYFEKQTKFFKYNPKNIMNKRILIILFLLYMKIQISISDNPVITSKINKSGRNKIISMNYIKYLSEVYINDIKMTKIDNFYEFDEGESTVKIKLNAQLTNYSKLFHECSNITEIKFENFDTSNIITLAESFYKCSQLKSIDLSDWDISKVTNISSLFENRSIRLGYLKSDKYK